MNRFATPRSGLPLVLAALLAAAVCLPAQAQWKWRGANGQITVSDLPPPRGTPEADILQRPAPVPQARAAAEAASAASAPGAALPTLPPPVDAELQARKQAAEQEQAARRRADDQKLAERRQQNCRNARNQMLALQSGQPMAQINEKGERVVMDDKARGESMRQAREVIASDCR